MNGEAPGARRAGHSVSIQGEANGLNSFSILTHRGSHNPPSNGGNEFHAKNLIDFLRKNVRRHQRVGFIKSNPQPSLRWSPGTKQFTCFLTKTEEGQTPFWSGRLPCLTYLSAGGIEVRSPADKTSPSVCGAGALRKTVRIGQKFLNGKGLCDVVIDPAVQTATLSITLSRAVNIMTGTEDVRRRRDTSLPLSRGASHLRALSHSPQIQPFQTCPSMVGFTHRIAFVGEFHLHKTGKLSSSSMIRILVS